MEIPVWAGAGWGWGAPYCAQDKQQEKGGREKQRQTEETKDQWQPQPPTLSPSFG